MTGRGRGRGALARWEASKPVGESAFRSGASAAQTLSKDNRENEKGRQKKQDVTSGSTNIRVTHLIDVEHFWAQVGSLEELEQFDKYMDALNSWCDQQQPSKSHQIPVCGQPVCVRHADTNQWRRAQVTRLSNSMVDVFYLDYGQVECVQSERLCSSTPSDFMARPPLAQYITLEGVQPVGGEWSPEANHRFSELVSTSKNLTVRLSDNCRGELFLRNNRAGLEVSVGDVLISEGHAKKCDESVNRGPSWELDDRSGGQETKFLDTEKNDKMDQHWNTISFKPPLTQQPSWKNPVPTVQEVEQYNTGRSAATDLPFSSKEQPLPGGHFSSSTSYAPTFSPPQFHDYDEVHVKQDASGISLNDVPLPPNLESDKLETFNIRRIGQAPTEAVRTVKPYLASPKEFLSHSRGQETQLAKGDFPMPKNELHLKYQPPHVRNAQAKETETTSVTEPHIMQHFPPELLNSQKNQNFHAGLPNTTTSSSLQQSANPPYGNFMFRPSSGRSNIAAQFQSNSVNKGEITQQQSASHLPQQIEFLKTQPLNENTRDKTLKAELEWKIWKFQRGVKSVLDRMVADSGEDFAQEFAKIITKSRLSRDFPGLSEIFIVLELLIERVLDKETFAVTAVKVCILLRDMSVPELSDHVGRVLSESQHELVEQCNASDSHKRWRRFSLFVGMLYSEVLNEADPTGLKSAVDAFVADSLHNWMSFDQAEPEAVHELKAISLKSFFKVTGSTIDQTEGNEISRYFNTIRNLVLSQDLAVHVKGLLLDILLLRAGSWTTEDDTDEQETGSLSTEDEVFVEKEDDDDDEGAEDLGEGEEWDPYFKVKVMLKSLKLQDLLPKFFENCIRDSLLTADWEELKRTLQEACFPPGVILEIRMYLDKGILEKETERSSKAETTKRNATPSSAATQQPKDGFKPFKAPSPTKSMEHGIEINKLNNELQQLMLKDSEDTSGAASSTSRKISPQRELAGYDGTPYSRGGSRKFVSRAERRRSTESPSEDVPSTLTGSLSGQVENLGPPSIAPVEHSSFGTSSIATRENQSASTMSYSAVLKNSSAEATKSGSSSNAKSNQFKTFSRPPPGFPPLPTHGGDTEMHMTVLSNKTKPKQSGAGGGARRKSPTRADANPTRADANLNWRSDRRNEPSPQGPAPHTMSPPSGHAMNWRRMDEVAHVSPRSGNLSDSSPRKNEPDVGPTNSRESYDAPVAPPRRPFGPGGLKACVICGSKDHLRCNNRSKMFLD